jgi:hypothetical protein
MKKLIGLAVSLSVLMFTNCFAMNGFPNLKLDIKLPTTSNIYFLCIAGEGCLSIKASDQGKVFPLVTPDMSNLNKFVVADASHDLEVHEQLSPASCNVEVKDNQTLTITGTVVATKNDQVYVQNLQCHVA